MALIRLNKGLFGNLDARRRGQTNITFKSNPVVGKVPLLKLFSVVTGGTDFFKVKELTSMTTSVANRINFGDSYRRYSFRKNMRNHMPMGNPQSTLVLSMLSVLGMQGKTEETLSQGIMSQRGIYSKPTRQNVLVTNPIDVFVLAMIEPKDISKINFSGEGNFIEFDSKLITLYVSEDKFKNPDYLDKHYNKTVAKHLRSEVTNFARTYNIKIEVVPDTILKLYYTNPYSVQTNSVFEIMEIDEHVKEKVFKTVSENLMEVR